MTRIDASPNQVQHEKARNFALIAEFAIDDVQ